MNPNNQARGSRRGRILFVLLLLNGMWGTTDFAAKIAMRDLEPAAVAWLRFTVALLAFMPFLIRRRAEWPRSLKELIPFLALGLCGFYLNFLLNYQGLKLAPASHATALRVSESLAIALLSVVILRERIGRAGMVGFGFGLVGVALVLGVDPTDLSLFRSGYRLGDLLILLGVVVEGLYTVIGKKVLVHSRPLTATALACACGWCFLTASSLPEIAGLCRHPPGAAAALACVYLGLVATALGYTVWYGVLRTEQSHRVGMTIVAQPLVGIPLAAIALGEGLSASFLAGAVLIAAGVYLVLGRTSTVRDESVERLASEEPREK
jgi:drug/metabolite transporter (DMT)-like permease